MPFYLRIVIGIIIIALVQLYFFKTFFRTISYFSSRPQRKRIKILVAVFLFVFNLYPIVLLSNWIVSLLLDGVTFIRIQEAFYDYFILFPFWIFILTVIQADLFFLLFEPARIILRRFIEENGKYLKIEVYTFSAVIILSIIYVPIRIIYDYNIVRLREVTVSLENINEDLESFRLVFITDIQADRYTTGKRIKTYIDLVNEADADLVLSAGDFITSGPEFVDTAANYAGKIQSEMGVYSCIGDHDHWVYREDSKRSLRELSTALQEDSVYLIHNRNIRFDYKSAGILVTFVTNSYVDAIKLDSLLELTSAKGEHDLNIFLTHQPRQQSIEAAIGADYDLFLAGHTHGGQITFLFPFKNLSPTLFETKFVHGKFTLQDMTLIVSSGLGMSLAPVRYNSTPEVILFRFKNKN